jgi:sarcosine oxidase
MPHDCIVLGLGGFGSSTVRQLARRGVSVLGIEQFGPAHDRGSSHGETRVIRRAYYEHPDYVPIVSRAYELWHELERETGQQLYTRTGLLMGGHHASEAVAGTKSVISQHQLDIHEVPLADARRDFPTFQFREDDGVLFESDAGYLFVEECVRAQLDRAAADGAELRFNEPAVSIDANGSSVRVRTSQGEYTAAKLIVAGGAWSGRLLADLRLPLTVLRKVLMWYPIADGSAERHQRAPVFLFQDDEGVFYGFPSLDGRTLKMAEHSAGRPIDDPDRLDRSLQPHDTAPVDTFIARRLRGIERPPMRHGVCMYTMTPDQHFIVDRHPQHDNIVIGAGFSGHGFKFTPAVGEVLADMALKGRTSLPIAFLSINRAALQL